MSTTPSPAPSDDEAAESAAMAAMMGFTSFGSQTRHEERPNKKRRYNPRADAATAFDEAAGGEGEDGDGDDDDDDDGAAEWGTGANTLPLMPRTARVQAGQGIDGKEGSRDRKGDGATKEASVDGAEKSRDGDVGDGVTGEEREEGEPGPRYIDTSRSPLRTGGDDEVTGVLPVRGGGFTEHRSASSAQRGGRGGGVGGRRIWWTDYYDPSSNENPWEWLEKEKGLEPVGTWLPRGHARRIGGGKG